MAAWRKVRLVLLICAVGWLVRFARVRKGGLDGYGIGVDYQGIWRSLKGVFGRV